MRELGFDKKLMSFSKQNRKEKLEFYSFFVWTEFSFYSKILLANDIVWGKPAKFYKLRKSYMSLGICLKRIFFFNEGNCTRVGVYFWQVQLFSLGFDISRVRTNGEGWAVTGQFALYLGHIRDNQVLGQISLMVFPVRVALARLPCPSHCSQGWCRAGTLLGPLPADVWMQF